MTEAQIDALLESLSSISSTLKNILDAETINFQSVSMKEMEELAIKRHQMEKKELENSIKEVELRAKELNLRSQRLDVEARELQKRRTAIDA